MRYLADPPPTQTSAPYDDSDLRADLEAAIKAIPAPPDLTPYALKSEIPSSAIQKAEIEAIFDPLPAPQPIAAPATMNGATLVSGVTGSQMVNGGKVHSFARTSTPPAPNTWNGTLSISPVTGACKVRFGITSAILGTIEVSIDGAAPLTASNTGLGWSSATPEIAVFVDAGFTWFEVAIASTGNIVSVNVKIPTGRGLLPTIYATNAITSLIPATPTGLKLRAMPGGEELIYRPSELAKKTDIPTVDLSLLTSRVIELENRPVVVPDGIVAWSSEGNLITQLNSAHPSGGLMKEWVLEVEGNAIDVTLGSGTTASAFKTALGVPSTDSVIRIKAGIADALIADNSAIPTGLYRLWHIGEQVRMRVLDS